MLADMPEMLRCLRCGACLNHCVVYRAIGGHAYGGAYPGPMGSVLTPVFDGLEKTRDLPSACTLNGQCRQVCPVDIPLPTMLRHLARAKLARRLRAEDHARRDRALGLFRRAAQTLPIGAGLRLARVMRLFARGGWISSLPLASGWTAARDLPKPPGESFLASIRKGGTP